MVKVFDYNMVQFMVHLQSPTHSTKTANTLIAVFGQCNAHCFNPTTPAGAQQLTARALNSAVKVFLSR